VIPITLEEEEKKTCGYGIAERIWNIPPTNI